MSYPQRRMTRSQCARVAAALAKAEETGESSGPRPRRNPNKADSSWISNVIDLTISKRVGDQATTGDEVESMAPGGGLGRVKARFVKNHTSLTSPRIMNRVQPNDPSETSRKQSSDVPHKMEVCSKAATETQAVAPTTESTTNRVPPKSRLAPTIGGQDPSSSHQSQSTQNQSQSAGHKAPSASPQEQPDDNQTQSQAPNITSFGLRDEETDSGKQTNETDQDDADETVSSASKRKRGPTMAIGRPKERAESAKFSSQVGVVARDVLPVVRKWKEIDVQNALDPCIDHMQ
ncbi:hypothetical protein CASFOL_038793 [Castilleja foliolosa]|uniref:Uncharacterized protein n=1 Tax=Castilleja foliolosa TaxID=1961234 RepID=A0ABD3BKX5_9LAMI